MKLALEIIWGHQKAQFAISWQMEWDIIKARKYKSVFNLANGTRVKVKLALEIIVGIICGIYDLYFSQTMTLLEVIGI